MTQVDELNLACGEDNTLEDKIGTIVEAIATTEAGNLKKLSLHGIDLSLAEAPPDSDYLSLSRYLSFFSFT